MTRTLSSSLGGRLAAVLGRLLLLAPVLWALHALPALAADEYEPFNEATRVKTDPNPFILGAYGFIWVALVVYVVMLARGLGKAQGELEALRRRVDRTG
jgi:CcmD family protein